MNFIATLWVSSHKKGDFGGETPLKAKVSRFCLYLFYYYLFVFYTFFALYYPRPQTFGPNALWSPSPHATALLCLIYRSELNAQMNRVVVESESSVAGSLSAI